jgi:acyl-CoA reductase-like NAD-dependent aldehyde dehydrogenase
MNAGQTCIAPDTLFVHEKHVKGLCSALVRAIESQFGKDQKKGELGRIVNAAQTTRVIELIKDAEAAAGSTIIHGGSKLCDVDTRYICPTLILNPPSSSRVMQEEIFGPVIPIVSFASRNEAIEKIQNLDGTPLQLYVFTTKNETYKEYTDKCRCAASVRNDALVQASSYFIPFGGLGSSGYGSYSGKFGFEAFTHLFATVHRPIGSMWDINNLRCHPYAGFKGKVLEVILMLPDIGVLHTRRLLFGMGLLALASASPSGVQYLKLGLADILEMLVEALRK